MPLPFILKGSETGDIQSDTDQHPFATCPDSPNCIIVSKSYRLEAKELFSATRKALDQMKPIEAEIDSQSLQIKAVFRIPVFLFKDDMAITVSDENQSILHIKSSSRIGHGDMGVNRRRVQKLLSLLNKHL